MKALIFTLIIGLSSLAQAREGINPEFMTAQQQIQLLQVLNQLEPEVLSSILSEEGLDWYIAQYNRMADEGEIIVEEAHSRIDLGSNPYDDPNAPSF